MAHVYQSVTELIGRTPLLAAKSFATVYTGANCWQNNMIITIHGIRVYVIDIYIRIKNRIE